MQFYKNDNPQMNSQIFTVPCVHAEEFFGSIFWIIDTDLLLPIKKLIKIKIPSKKYKCSNSFTLIIILGIVRLQKKILPHSIFLNFFFNLFQVCRLKTA